MTKLSAVLDQIDSGTMLLPEFQRGYVWNRDQVRGLMRSVYRGYPVGGLLVWETEPDSGTVRGQASSSAGAKRLLLDGQQRITSLYGVMRGKPPEFFEGDAGAFTGLRFNVAEETFEFYAPAKMNGDPHWIDVTALFTGGPGSVYTALNAHPATQPQFATFVERVARLHGVRDREFHEEKITGRDKTVEVVVDIFNRVNSGGTKLSKGDLALAQICAHWPQARATMRQHLATWQAAGFDFTLDWLLRNATAVATGRAEFASLDPAELPVKDFEQALASSAKYVGRVLDAAGGRLGLDHDRVLMGRGAVPVISRLLHLSGGQFEDAVQRDRALYWYIQSALWGRFAGSTETVLNSDYDTAARSGVDGLIAALERWRGGNLVIDAADFEASSIGSRFYPLLYLLTRVGGAQDFGSGLPLHKLLLSPLSSLQVHHIFPKAVLYKAGVSRREVNAVANFCFLTQETNLAIGKREPEEYFVEIKKKHPGALASQWIPDDPELWRVERYPDFLAARRALLAQAANTFLDELRSGSAAEVASLTRIAVSDAPEEPGSDAAEVDALIQELTELGCAAPEREFEIPDPDTGHVLAVAEACWPDGLQTGQGKPTVLETAQGAADLGRLTELGYEVFTSADALRGYARRRNADAAGDDT